MSRFNDLIRQVENSDAQLAADLRREFDALAERRAFGLNFERHTPEAVELPGRPVRKNDKVRILPPRGEAPKKASERLFRVSAVSSTGDDRQADVVAMDDPDHQRSVPVNDLVVVAEFRDPIYPGLVSTGKVDRGGDKPFHTVINAENYHALQALLFSHRGQVDCIYIDPPYNTGNADWIYNDRYVSSDDLYRHSKWLAFMERRLVLARELMRDTGVLIVAIGEDEHHRLRLLLDQTFGEGNFLADVMWEGVRKNDSRYVSSSADYMLIYAKDESALARREIRWRESKPGTDRVLAAARAAWSDARGDAAAATAAFRRWWAEMSDDDPIRANPGMSVFSMVDDVRPGVAYSTSPMMSPNPRPNLKYAVIDPQTGRIYDPPNNGWRVTQDLMGSLIKEGRIAFGKTTLRRKVYLDEASDQGVGPYFNQTRARASGHLEKVLGDRRFPNPKDHEVLMRWIQLVMPPNGIILDFFGGSGSTVEAVMRLNALDGGGRQAILVSNNEVGVATARELQKSGRRRSDSEWKARGVFEYVTAPRLATVASGVRSDGSRYEHMVPSNVEFFELTYESAMRVASGRDFARVAAFLWMKSGARGRRIDEVPNGWDVAEAYGVIVDLDSTEKFVKAIEAAKKLTHVFIVTDEDRLFEALVRRLPDHVEPTRLYSAYLRNFEIEAARTAR